MNPDRQRLLKPRPHKKHRKAPQPASAHSNSTSINALKSNIRNVSRVLDHAQNLPLDVRIEKERALAGYKQDLEKAQHEKGRQRMIKKYHMVRFFERQKATRALKKLRARLPSVQRNSPEHEALEIQIHDAEVDLNYTLFYPLAEKYIGIFPCQERRTAQDAENVSGEDAAQTRQPKPAMWTVVASCIEKGTLQALRDGKLQIRTVEAKALPSTAARTAHPPIRPRQNKIKENGSTVISAAADGEDDSDGGFFEE